MNLAIEFPAIEPEIVSFTIAGFDLALRWYALAYIVGLILGWRLVVWLVRRPRFWAGSPPMNDKQPEDLLTWMVLGVVLGGRFGSVFFYNWDYYSQNLAQIPAIWQGGMSFHGGLLGVVVVLLGFSLKNRLPVLSVADAVACATPIGLFFGRIANFVNAELWGRPTHLPWGVIFPSAEAQICPPDFGPLCARHPSQLYEAGLEGLLLFIILMIGATRLGWLKRPGRATGVFLVGYGLARVAVEGVRQADAQFITPDNPMGHVFRLTAEWGLTMGQVLSLPMVAAGLVFLAISRRRA